MKIYLFSLLIPFFYLNGFAQQTYVTDQVNISSESTENPVDWAIYIDNESFKIEYKMTNCDPAMGFDFEAVFLKVTNKTSNKLAFSWHKELHYAGTCRTCDYPDEYSYDMSLEANQSVEAVCDPQMGYDLKMFSRFIDASYSNGDPLTAFKLGALTVYFN